MRRALHYWQTWVVVAYFFLAIFSVMLIRDDRRQVRDITARISDKTTAAETQYKACVASITTLKHANAFIAGVRGLSDVLLHNAIASHAATAPNTDLYYSQVASIQRLRDSKRLIRSVTFAIPTKAACAQQFVAQVGRSATVPR